MLSTRQSYKIFDGETRYMFVPEDRIIGTAKTIAIHGGGPNFDTYFLHAYQCSSHVLCLLTTWACSGSARREKFVQG